jgi:hypothetical protein
VLVNVALSSCSCSVQVFFDIQIGSAQAGKIVFELFDDVVPKNRTKRRAEGGLGQPHGATGVVGRKSNGLRLCRSR